jgi:hypothetical protein
MDTAIFVIQCSSTKRRKTDSTTSLLSVDLLARDRFHPSIDPVVLCLKSSHVSNTGVNRTQFFDDVQCFGRFFRLSWKGSVLRLLDGSSAPSLLAACPQQPDWALQLPWLQLAIGESVWMWRLKVL